MDIDSGSSDTVSNAEECYIESSIFERSSAVWRNTNLLFKHLDRKEPISEDSYSLDLIEAGCDVHARNEWGQTLLHATVKVSTVENVEALIKLGSDINGQTVHSKETPLFIASRYRRSDEMVCMLLYYDADAIADATEETPFTTRHAYETTRSRLYNFCEKDNLARKLLDASFNSFEEETKWIKQLVEDGANVNYVNNKGDHLLLHTLKYTTFDKHINLDLFKLIWARIDHQILTKLREPLLSRYIEHAKCTHPLWLELLYLMLGSPVAKELVADVKMRQILWSTPGSCINRLFQDILYRFQEMKMERKDRMAVIYLLSSLDLAIHKPCLEILHQNYGFSEELEAVIYCARMCDSYTCFQENTIFMTLDFRMGYFLCATQEDPNKEEVLKYLKNEMRFRPERVVYLLDFFWFPMYMQDQLINIALARRLKGAVHFIKSNTVAANSEVVLKLLTMPEIPSLLELSRDKLRVYIKQKFNVKKPYQFYDAVKMLPIPQPSLLQAGALKFGNNVAESMSHFLLVFD